jgi:hypothetical protein
MASTARPTSAGSDCTARSHDSNDPLDDLFASALTIETTAYDDGLAEGREQSAQQGFREGAAVGFAQALQSHARLAELSGRTDLLLPFLEATREGRGGSAAGAARAAAARVLLASPMWGRKGRARRERLRPALQAVADGKLKEVPAPVKEESGSGEGGVATVEEGEAAPPADDATVTATEGAVVESPVETTEGDGESTVPPAEGKVISPESDAAPANGDPDPAESDSTTPRDGPGPTEGDPAQAETDLPTSEEKDPAPAETDAPPTSDAATPPPPATEPPPELASPAAAYERSKRAKARAKATRKRSAAAARLERQARALSRLAEPRDEERRNGEASVAAHEGRVKRAAAKARIVERQAGALWGGPVAGRAGAQGAAAAAAAAAAGGGAAPGAAQEANIEDFGNTAVGNGA